MCRVLSDRTSLRHGPQKREQTVVGQQQCPARKTTYHRLPESGEYLRTTQLLFIELSRLGQILIKAVRSMSGMCSSIFHSWGESFF